MYWSIFDEPDVLDRFGLDNFSDNTFIQSQIWWQGSYWVLNYRENSGSKTNPKFSMQRIR